MKCTQYYTSQDAPLSSHQNAKHSARPPLHVRTSCGKTFSLTSHLNIQQSQSRQGCKVPHLTQDTNGKVTNLQLHTTSESQEVIPFPAGDHKAHINRRAQRHIKRKTEKHKGSTKEKPPCNQNHWHIATYVILKHVIKHSSRRMQ